MKKTLFRAIATEEYNTSTDCAENCSFVYGYYFFCRRRHSGIIIADLDAESGGVSSGVFQEQIEVDSSTLGQYANIRDTNEKEVYSGDILRGVFRKNIAGKIDLFVGEVAWYKSGFVILFNDGTKIPLSHFEQRILVKGSSKIEVIGNKHQNEDLLPTSS